MCTSHSRILPGIGIKEIRRKSLTLFGLDILGMGITVDFFKKYNS